MRPGWWPSALAAGLIGVGGAWAQDQRPDTSLYRPAVQDQVILNPEPAPHLSAVPRLRQVAPSLAALEPSAGTAEQATGCPIPDGWRVTVVRGNQAPDVVRGHMVTLLPAGC